MPILLRRYQPYQHTVAPTHELSQRAQLLDAAGTVPHIQMRPTNPEPQTVLIATRCFTSILGNPGDGIENLMHAANPAGLKQGTTEDPVQ